jgi:transposase
MLYFSVITKSTSIMSTVSPLWLKLFKSQTEIHKRLFAGEKAVELGRGGVVKISKLTGLSRTTITKGIKELKEPTLNVGQVRKKGSGRKRTEIKQKNIIQELENILDENTIGDPMSDLKWTCKTTRTISKELKAKGFSVSHQTVCKLLSEMDYSLQVNKKMVGTGNHPDRDAQFQYINNEVKCFIEKENPVISVDTKKKELVGNFKNQGASWNKKGQAPMVKDHDFRSYAEGVAIPYGAYDIKENKGFVNVGISSDTSEFAVNSIRMWWKSIGSKRYNTSKELLICADGGGSNGSRSRAWKFYLQKLSNEIGIDITVCHYPPGTSKWNKIEHRMFSFISINWKGKPLKSYQTIINLIGGTKTKKGLTIEANLDKNEYTKGIKISDQELKAINLKQHEKHPQWNYSIYKT